MDSGVDRVLGGLEAEFQAASARADDEAAADLAFSLRQDLDMREEIARLSDPHVLLAGGGRRPVSVVGQDFIGCGEPVERAQLFRSSIVVQGRGNQHAAPSPLTFLELLRLWARGCLTVQIELRESDVGLVGMVRRAATDHLTIEGPAGVIAVTIDRLAGVTRISEAG